MALWSRYINAVRDFDPRSDLMQWHKWVLILPAFDVRGRLICHLAWRRKTAKGWEYKKRALVQTEEQYLNDQW